MSAPADTALPRTEAELAERILTASDLVLEATLEREVQSEARLRSHLDFVQMKIRVLQAEKARRRGLDLTTGKNGV